MTRTISVQAEALTHYDKAEVRKSWWEDEAHVVTGEDVVLDELQTTFGQVRSRQRVVDLAEVFTHQREVDAILDIIPAGFDDPTWKYLEPAAGNGNFLVEILRRKLTRVSKADHISLHDYEHRVLVVLASIYGIDIDARNVADARQRMVKVLLEHFRTDVAPVKPTGGCLTAAALVLGSNVVSANTLTDAETLELCDWQPHPAGRFVRVWSHALVPEEERGLFWSERVQDAQPVHYSVMVAETRRPKRR